MSASEKQLLHIKKLADAKRIYASPTENTRAYRNRNPERYNSLRRKYYKANPVPHKTEVKRWQHHLTLLIWSLKNKPCTDCHLEYPPYVMQFDHVRGEKYKAVGQLTKRTEIFEEVKKCEVVCANCHAIRTWERRNQ